MLGSLIPSRGDVFGGISAGIVALPLCLAFGSLSGLGPEAGLYGAIAAEFGRNIWRQSRIGYRADQPNDAGRSHGRRGKYAADRRGKYPSRCVCFPPGRRPASVDGRAPPRRLYPLCALSGDLRFHERNRCYHHHPAALSHCWRCGAFLRCCQNPAQLADAAGRHLVACSAARHSHVRDCSNPAAIDPKNTSLASGAHRCNRVPRSHSA